MSVITVKNLNFTYPQNNKAALSDVSFGIEKGSYVAVVGYNGCGKSTLARLICGLEVPSSGTIQIEENNKIGIVFQSPKDQLVSGIVSRDTAFGPQNLGLKKGEVELRTIESLNIVDMLDRASSSTSGLSLGQTQKIALSGIIALQPEILILDEATSMLDPDSRTDILKFLRYWHKCGNTVIHITHDLEMLEDAESIIGMEEGRVIFYGTKRAFLEKEENVKRLCGETLKKNKRKYEGALNAKSPALKLQNLTYTHDSSHGVFDINLDFYRGSLNAVTGASGAGKSTLLELLAGLLEPESGQIYSCGNNQKKGRPVLAQQNAKAALFEAFAADDVAFGARNRGLCGKELVETVKKAMNAAALPYEDFAERRTFEMSGGEQRRLSIAGILVLDEDVVMFDEPTAGLDSRARNEIMALMRKLADEGKTVIFTTHKRDEADFADREIKITNGRVVFDTLKEVASSASPLSPLPPLESAGLISSLKAASTGITNPKKGKVSPVEKRSPVFRILLFLLLFTLSLAARPLWLCGLMLAVAVLYCLLCGFSLKKLFSASLKILPFLLIFSVFQIMFRPAAAGEIHFTEWRWFMITPSKLLFCLATIIRTDAALACISAFFVSTPEYDLMDGLKILLMPLQWLRLPVRYLILIMEIIFRFIPLLIDEAVAIIKTQSIRGGLGKEKGKMAKIRALVPLIVPLIIQTIKRSESLADAITMRCFK